VALPTPDKLWNFDVNVALPSLGSADADGRRFIRKLKTKILGGGAWTVKRSSNAAAVANSDLWSSDASVIYGSSGSPHSWIVLQRTDVAFELLLDVNHGSVYNYGTVVISRSGFTGGTVSNRPTATDAVYVIGTATNYAAWHAAGSAAFSSVLHCFNSADGQVQRIVALKANVTVLFIDLSTLKNPPSGWATPFVVGWVPSAPTFSAINNSGGGSEGRYFGFHGTLPIQAYLATEGYTVAGTASAIGALQIIQNELSAAWSMTPVAVVGYSPGTKGRHGNLYDLWFGEINKTNSTTYPADASRQFIQFSYLILPWANPPGPGPTVLTS
jgi:hypothetical protein